METLEAIANEIRAHKATPCQSEPCATCTNLVPGEGNHNSDILIVGEAPGKSEDLSGRPFIGQAGKLLDELIASIELTRDDVFITNIVKARPPENRDPTAAEVQHHRPWLDRQIAVIQPKLIVPLGRHAMHRFFPQLKIGEAHGQLQLLDGRAYLPLYHPAAALYNRSLMPTLAADFAKIPLLLQEQRTAASS
ncbi:MAG: uracil-DNA glycosylase [Thermoleophilaceae bacterium]|nr:uracil-DNA glycosylase [Thermoleophilaceae bacterium]